MNCDFEYLNSINRIMRKAVYQNADAIRQLAEMIAENMMNDHLIFVFGTGHSSMLATELFSRAGGIANIVPIFDPDALTSFGSLRSGAMERLSGISDIIFEKYKPVCGDLMIINSNSGRNAMPIEMALRCKREGVKVVAVTSMEHSKKSSSRHSSNLRLFEIADLVIDNCAPEGDCALQAGDQQVGPCSSIITLSMIDCAVCEAVKLMQKKGFRPYVFSSQNVDGKDNDNIRSYMHYHKRISTL